MRLLPVTLFAILIALFDVSCTKPTENINIVLSTNVIKYSAVVHVTDAGNPGFAPANLSLTLSGQNAADIYEISGKKNFTITDGIISLGPGPALTPTTENPVTVDLNLAAAGYNSVVKTVQFVPGQMQQVVDVVMARTGAAPATTRAVVNETETKVPVTFNFIGLCANKSNFELLPSIYLFYRETGSGAGYAYLGYMDKGQITANLVMGKTYDLKLTYAGVNYVVTQRIDATSYNERITLGDICSTF